MYKKKNTAKLENFVNKEKESAGKIKITGIPKKFNSYKERILYYLRRIGWRNKMGNDEQSRLKTLEKICAAIVVHNRPYMKFDENGYLLGEKYYVRGDMLRIILKNIDGDVFDLNGDPKDETKFRHI